jgi:POT family proton-dependent oligopeptide transporter
MTTADAPAEKKLFGHPRGLTYLFTTEMAERFSYYGMTAILVYYLTLHLLLPGNVEHVIGFATARKILEWMFGPLSVQQMASNIYGLYTGLVYLTPFFGGILADRVIGQRYTVIIGGALMATGEFVLTQDSLFFLGLLLLIVGNGAFKPNISTQVGNLYKAGDARIDRAYSIFYVGINIGATLSPLICGTLGEKVGWHWGFFAAGVGVTLGLLVYLFALRTLPPDRIARAKAAGARAPSRLTGADWKAVAALVMLCIPTAFFWMSYQQASNTIALWALNSTNRVLIPGLINVEIPATWFQSFNPAMIFAFTPFVIALWARQQSAGKEPSVVSKMTIGCFLLAASYVIMAVAAYVTGTGLASWIWLLLFFAVYTTGELYVSPIGLSLVARIAPPQILSMMMGVWFITSFVGNSASGYIGGFYDVLSKPNFFLLTAAIAAGAGVVMWLFERPLRPILESRAHAPAVGAAAPAE